MSKRPEEQSVECIDYVAGQLAQDYWQWNEKQGTLEDAKNELMYALEDVFVWDGYSLAKSLEDEYCISPDEHLVETLSRASLLGSRWVAKATKEWVEQEHIEPQLKEGDQVSTRQGVGPIDSIYRTEAKYVVAISGHKYIFPYEEVKACT